MTTNKDSPSLLNITQVARRLNFNAWTVREMLRNGELTGSRIKNRWRVRPSDLEKYIESLSNKK